MGKKSDVFCRFVEGEGAGYSGTLGDHRDNLGSGGRGMQGGVGRGGLFLKSNNPNLSGGEQTQTHTRDRANSDA